jgi:transposase
VNYVGIDHHKKSNHITVMDEHGTVIKRGTVSNRRKDLEGFLQSLKGPSSAVFESSAGWTVLYDNLADCVSEMHLAHPYKTRIIAEAKIKTDKIDSEILAHLLRSNMVPEAHIPSKEVQHIRHLVRQRLFFVRLRTMSKNRMHRLIERNHLAEVVSDAFSDVFGKAGMAFLEKVSLPETERKLLNEQLALLKKLNRLVAEDDKRLKALFEKDRRVALVATVPGLGYLFAPLIVYEIDTIDRFATPAKLHAYAGIVPSTYASGEKCYHGKLIKMGNRYLRWAMIEAVWPAIRKDPSLRQYYNGVKKGRDNKAATIATARRLLTIVYRILKEQRPYRPGVIQQNQNRSRAALSAI